MGNTDMKTIRTRDEKKAEDIAEALRQDNIQLQTSGRIMAENLEILRGKMAEIHRIATAALAPDQVADFEVIQTIMELAAPNDDAPAA